METIGAVTITIGVVFMFLGALGLVRMPDIYNRLQAGTKATTLGFIGVALGAGFYNPVWFPKLILMVFFLVLTAPVSSHNLARAAYIAGIKPEGKVASCDRTKKEGEDESE
ncbi:MAG: monovalent cation/H(+) antiporter subunit G [Deltaproteobacteria bacterium]|nr:monovalent cation/H(+) antiporter subunit G [Deltaproteobacteria bacterium]